MVRTNRLPISKKKEKKKNMACGDVRLEVGGMW